LELTSKFLPKNWAPKGKPIANPAADLHHLQKDGLLPFTKSLFVIPQDVKGKTLSMWDDSKALSSLSKQASAACEPVSLEFGYIAEQRREKTNGYVSLCWKRPFAVVLHAAPC